MTFSTVVLVFLLLLAVYGAMRTLMSLVGRRYSRKALVLIAELSEGASEEDIRVLAAITKGATWRWVPPMLAVFALLSPIAIIFAVIDDLVSRHFKGEQSATLEALLDKAERSWVKRWGVSLDHSAIWDSPKRKSLSDVIDTIAFLRSPLAVCILCFLSPILAMTALYAAVTGPFILKAVLGFTRLPTSPVKLIGLRKLHGLAH